MNQVTEQPAMPTQANDGALLRAQENRAPIVQIKGELDFWTAPAARRRLMRLLRQGHVHLVVDLTECDYVDSSGMLALAATAFQAAEARGAVRLLRPSSTLIKMLQLSHLGEILGIPPGSAAPRAHRVCFVDTGVGQWTVVRLVAPAAPCFCALARRSVLDEAMSTPLSPEERADLELAVGEAFANAVRHGSPRKEKDRVTVRVLRGCDALVVEVSDTGHGFDRSAVVAPQPASIREGGMGIFYMEKLMDSVEFDSGQHGTTVRLVKLYPEK